MKPSLHTPSLRPLGVPACQVGGRRSTEALLVSLLASAASAQPDPLWIEQFGTEHREQIHAAAADDNGGVFVAGTTYGSLGGLNAGASDAFLARYNNTGTRIWMAQFGTDKPDNPWSLAPDGTGGALVAGFTQGALGGGNAGAWDIFIARYDGTGARAWITQLGTGADDGYFDGAVIASDNAGGALVGGYTSGDLGGPNAGWSDSFLARYDSTGQQSWILQFGTPLRDELLAIAPDGLGGAFVGGWTLGILGGPAAGKSDAFLARYNSAGGREWIVQFGTDELDHVNALTADGAGGVFVTGETTGGLGGPNAGARDVFLARYDAQGQQIWMTQFGTDDHDTARSLAPDVHGGVFVAGYIGSAYPQDSFLARHDGAGNQAWILSFGRPKPDQARGLAPDGGGGGVFVGGWTGGDLGGPNAGEDDAYLARFGAPCYPDCDGDGTLNLFDFLCFTNQFNAGDSDADCTGDGGVDLFDFLCFINAFEAGC
jgi:hypothetical protein